MTTTTSEKNVDLSSKNLRIVVKDDVTEVHYAFIKSVGRLCRTAIIAVDKGYAEAFVDSDGDKLSVGLGQIMTEYSDKTSKAGKARNKLYALEKKHRAVGHTAKADRIRANNLGTTKINARKDKADVVISEDLSRSIARKRP